MSADNASASIAKSSDNTPITTKPTEKPSDLTWKALEKSSFTKLLDEYGLERQKKKQNQQNQVLNDVVEGMKMDDMIKNHATLEGRIKVFQRGLDGMKKDASEQKEDIDKLKAYFDRNKDAGGSDSQT